MKFEAWENEVTLEKTVVIVAKQKKEEEEEEHKWIDQKDDRKSVILKTCGQTKSRNEMK